MNATDITFKIAPIVFAVLMIGWAVAYALVGSQFDACSADVNTGIERVKGKIEKNQTLLDNIRQRNDARGAGGSQPK
jgi:hypothetical protein